MAVADFSLPRYLDQSNTDLVPNAMAKGAAVGTSIAQVMQGAQRLKLMQAEDARQQQEFQMKAQAEAMRYQGFQNFARDREILKAQGLDEEKAGQQALMKNLHLITAGDPRALSTVINQSTDNTRDIQRLTDLRAHQTESDRLRAAEMVARKETELEKESGRSERSYDRLKFQREKEVSDTETELEKEQGRNLRAYEGRTARAELAKEKSKTTKAIEARLSTNDRLAMQGEISALDKTADDYTSKVDAINAKYEALRTGKPTPQQLRFEANQQTIRENLAKHDAAKGALGGAAPEVREDAVQAAGKTKDNPITITPETDFNAIPVGSWFINPKDGKVMRKTK